MATSFLEKLPEMMPKERKERGEIGSTTTLLPLLPLFYHYHYFATTGMIILAFQPPSNALTNG